MADPLVCERLTAGYGRKPALIDAALGVGSGELVCLVGPNGAGKSTLIRAAAGLLRPFSGEVRLFGRPLSSWSRREMARRVAVVLQSGIVPPLFTVREIVEMGRAPFAGFWGDMRARDARIAEEALAAFGLDALADRRLGELSGGEAQRAVLARALAQEPELLLLDEPTVHLDIHREAAALAGIRELARRGAGVLVALHDLNLASAFADRLALLQGGRILRAGPPLEVLGSEELLDAYERSVRVVGLPGQPERPIVLPDFRDPGPRYPGRPR